MNFKHWVFAALIVLGFTGESFADKILLKNGDRLSGKVVSAKEGVLTFSTAYSEDLKIKINEIKKIITDNPNVIHLKTGEILKGRLLPSEDQEDDFKLEASSGRSPTILDWTQIKAINPPKNHWKGHLGAGAQWDTGNTERFSGSFAADAHKRWEHDRFEFKFLFNYAEEDDEVTARNTYGSMQFSHYFTKKWYGFLSLEMLNDTFKDLNLRTIVGPGAGYQIWEDDIKFWSLEAGVSYFNEDRVTGADEQYATGRFATNFKYQILKNLLFTDQYVIFPSFENFGEYNFRNQAALITTLGAGWEFKFSNIWEYESEPTPGFKESDLRWIMALQYAF